MKSQEIRFFTGSRPRGLFPNSKGSTQGSCSERGMPPGGPSLQPVLMENSLRGTGLAHLQLQRKQEAVFIWEESRVFS